VAEALLRAAAIEEKLKNPQEALALYKQVASEYKGSPAATAAEQSAARLGNAKG
jgi:TolA-binding protein